MSREDANDAGTSRRTALKAGIGVGVGLTAWSAPSITALGGTPVYASGCTFVETFNVTGCRNTTQGSCTGPFRYQPLSSPGGGYTFIQNTGNNVCCDAPGNKAVLQMPSGIECAATVSLYLGNNCGTIAPFDTESYGPSTGTLDVFLTCLGNATVPPNTFYDIVINCNTEGAPDFCIQ